MLKRKPYIAFIILLITIAGIIWAAWILGHYIFYNPIEPIRIADLPAESISPPPLTFAEIKIEGMPNHAMVYTINTPLITITAPKDESFSYTQLNESSYILRARTRLAFDPVKDENLRIRLRELLKARDDEEKSRLDLALAIYLQLSPFAGDAKFRETLYRTLLQETLNSSFENPDIYPLRLAEAKSNFYESKLQETLIELSKHDDLFKKAVEEQWNALLDLHNKNDEQRVLEIRDYLLTKTSDIETEVQLATNGNSGLPDKK